MSRAEEQVVTVRGVKFIRLKSGRHVSFYDAKREAKSGLTILWRSVARMGAVAQPFDGDFDIDWEQIEWMLDDVQAFVNLWRKEVEKRTGQRTRQERIDHLRLVAGRTPEEAALYRAKADELEREGT